MSNDVMIPEVGAVPAHLKSAAPVESGLVTGSESLPRISLKGKQFRFIIGGEEKMTLPLGTPLDVTILGASPKVGTSKVYYEGAWNSGDAEAPDCSSADGMYHDSNINKPISEMCQTCPKNEWGSGKRQDGTPSDGKACRDTKTLFVVGKKVSGTMLQLRVPVMSLKSLNSLGHALENRRLHPYAIITRMSFVDSEFPQVEFSFKEFLDEATYAEAKTRAESDELQKLINGVGTKPRERGPVIPDAPEHVTTAEPEKEAGTTTTAVAQETETVDIGSIWPDKEVAPAGAGLHDASVPLETTQSTDQQVFRGPGQTVDGSWYDSKNVMWDKAIHGTSADGTPAFKKDGTFKKRKGTGGSTVQQPVQQIDGALAAGPDTGTGSPPVTEEDVMDGWV